MGKLSYFQSRRLPYKSFLLYFKNFLITIKKFSTILINPIYWSLWVSGQLYLTQSQGQASYDLWTEFNWPSREPLKLRKRKFHHTPLLPSEKSSHTEKSTKVIGNTTNGPRYMFVRESQNRRQWFDDLRKIVTFSTTSKT